MSEKLEDKLPEAEKYKQEAAKLKEELHAAFEKAEPYILHMQARHVEGLHKLYKEKLGYTGIGDPESMNEFKHDYFSKKENHEETIDFITDFHVHRALLAYGLIKSKKPIHKLSENEFKTLTAEAQVEAVRLRQEEKSMYNRLLQDYSGLSTKKLQQLLKEHEHQFTIAYSQKLLPEILAKHQQERVNMEHTGILDKITEQHKFYDPELKKMTEDIVQQKRQLAYMQAMQDEELDGENYKLPQRRVEETAIPQMNSGAPPPPSGGQVAPTPGAQAPGPSA